MLGGGTATRGGPRIAREVETFGPGGRPPGTHPPDHWSGSRQRRPGAAAIWNWLAPRIGGGEVLERASGSAPRRRADVDVRRRVPHALDRLAARGGGPSLPGTSLPPPGRPFDAVLAFEVTEHVDADTELLAEIGRVTRPDGSRSCRRRSTPRCGPRSTTRAGKSAATSRRRSSPRSVRPGSRSAATRGAGLPPSASRSLARGPAVQPAAVHRVRADDGVPFHAAYQRIFGRVRGKRSRRPSRRRPTT